MVEVCLGIGLFVLLLRSDGWILQSVERTHEGGVVFRVAVGDGG